MAADTGKPVMRLKDLLELDCDSCSADGFRCYPRRLGESSPTKPVSFCRSPPSSLRHSSNKLAHVSRSLSRRLRGSFWWRRRSNDDVEEEELDAAVHGCGCCSEADTSTSESSDSSGTRRSRFESDSDLSSAASESVHAAAGDEHEDAVKKRGGREEGSSSGSEASPVAVMAFPCFDDDCSPSSDDSLLPRLQGGRKIRQFGRLDELGPVDLEAHLAGTPDADDQDDVPARQLQGPAEETTPPRPTSVDDMILERLLLDLLVEMKMERRSERASFPAPAGSPPRGKAARLGDGEILAAARGWLFDGARAQRWVLEDVLRGGEAVLAEMERGRRWMQVDEEEREVGTVVAGVLTDQLVEEVLADLLGW